MITQIVLGIDIGGTNADFAFIDLEGRILYKENIPTEMFTTPNSLVQLVKKRSDEALSKTKSQLVIRGIGIGAPNGNYYRGTVEFAPNMKWEGIVPLAEYFKMAFGLPCFLTNDANAAAIGEMMYGNAKNVSDFIMITLGTGLGSGIVVNNQIVYGHDGFAGELGHVIVYPNGRKCGCGRNGCLETYASVTGIKRTVVQMLEEGNYTSELEGMSLQSLSGERIEQAALNGDQLAKDAFDFTGKVLGKALANAIAITSPSLIVLFGGLAQSGNLILKPTKKEMEDSLLQIYRNKVPIILSGLKGNEAALLGSAALVWKELGMN
jgi:glucokinase